MNNVLILMACILCVYVLNYVFSDPRTTIDDLMEVDIYNDQDEELLSQFTNSISTREELENFHKRLEILTDVQRNNNLIRWSYFLRSARRICPLDEYEHFVLSAEVNTGLSEHQILFPPGFFDGLDDLEEPDRLEV